MFSLTFCSEKGNYSKAFLYNVVKTVVSYPEVEHLERTEKDQKWLVFFDIMPL